MKLKTIIDKLRRVLLCCRQDKSPVLEISHPADVRRVDISDALPGLTDAQRKYIREKASSDAIHLLALQSLPPSHPVTSTPSLNGSPSPPASRISSREPSEALLNAASKNLPSALPTPPPQKHHENSPPATRMRGMREPIRRSSSTTTHTRNELFEKLEKVKDAQDEQRENTSFMTLNLDFHFEEKILPETPRTLSLTEGFEEQSTIGGQSEVNSRMHSPLSLKTSPLETKLAFHKARDAKTLDDSSDSECEMFLSQEQSPLVKI